MKILVVDDEKNIVEGIVLHLKKMQLPDIVPAGATSGQEALAMMEYFSPDLVVTDIQMPDMDGLTLIAEAKKRVPCEHFLILTAYERFDYAKQAIAQQVMDYMVKPLDWDEFDAHIFALANDRTAQNQAQDVLARYSDLFAVAERTDVSRVLGKMTRYIHKNYTKDISLVTLSVYAGLSENYICALFKKELEVTFLDYVGALRLHKAMELLLTQRDKPIAEIAQMVGYHSDRQFFRMFKTLLDMTPQAFREQNL